MGPCKSLASSSPDRGLGTSQILQWLEDYRQSCRWESRRSLRFPFGCNFLSIRGNATPVIFKEIQIERIQLNLNDYPTGFLIVWIQVAVWC